AIMRDARIHLHLPAAPASLPVARRAIAALESLHRRPDLTPDLALLVSEVVGNAVEHTDGEGRIDVSARIEGDHVRVEVSDGGPGFDPGSGEMPGVDAESGRGLSFLHRLADRWGVARDGRRSAVWFTMRLSRGAPAA